MNVQPALADEEIREPLGIRHSTEYVEQNLVGQQEGTVDFGEIGEKGLGFGVIRVFLGERRELHSENHWVEGLVGVGVLDPEVGPAGGSSLGLGARVCFLRRWLERHGSSRHCTSSSSVS